jgi:hypothetical protein
MTPPAVAPNPATSASMSGEEREGDFGEESGTTLAVVCNPEWVR